MPGFRENSAALASRDPDDTVSQNTSKAEIEEAERFVVPRHAHRRE